MSQLKKGIILSYINIGLTNIIGLVLTPFIIRSLGDSEYGLYTLIGSFVAYLSLMDLGLNNTIVRFVAKYRTVNNAKAEQRFLGSIFIVYIAISLLVVALGVIIYNSLDNFFSNSLTAIELEKAKVMFQILVFNMAIVLPGGAFTAVCNAYERFVWPRAIAILKYVSRAVIVVAVLTKGGGAISLVIIDTILNILVISATILFVFKRLKLRFSFKNAEFKFFKTILNYSTWIFLLGIANQFLWSGGQIILGVETDTKTVAYYGVGVMLGGYYSAFSVAISSVFLPRATQMSVHNSKEEVLEMMVRIGRLLLLILLFILTSFILFGREFIVLWVGEKYMSSYIIAVVIMLVYTIPLLLSFADSLIEAYNKVRFKVIVYLVFFSLGLFFGYYLIPGYKQVGMIIGISLGWIISQVIMIVYYHNNLKLNMYTFFKESSKGIVLPSLLLFIVAWFININSPDSFIYFIIKILVYATIYWAVMYFYSMNTYEKNLIRKIK